MMTRGFVLTVLLAGAPAWAQLVPQAPWSQAEYDSLVAMDAGCFEGARAIQEAFQEWAADGQPVDVYRQAFSDVVQELGEAMMSCNQARAAFVGSTHSAAGGDGISRAEQVALAKSNVGGIVDRLQRALEHVPTVAVSTAGAIQSGLEYLGGFDASLAFDSWQPTYYPTLVGFHGHYDTSFKEFTHAVRYLCGHSTNDLGRLLDVGITPVFSESARSALRAAGYHMRRVCLASQKAFGIEALVFQPDDWARLQADVAAARTQGRGEAFFKTVLALEYSFRTTSPPHFSGREPTAFSVATSIFALSKAVGAAVQGSTGLASVNDPLWSVQQLSRAGGVQIGKTISPYIELLSDLLDGWQALDGYGWGTMGFFEGVSAPPSEPPSLECPAFTAEMILTSPTEALCTLVER